MNFTKLSVVSALGCLLQLQPAAARVARNAKSSKRGDINASAFCLELLDDVWVRSLQDVASYHNFLLAQFDCLFANPAIEQAKDNHEETGSGSDPDGPGGSFIKHSVALNEYYQKAVKAYADESGECRTIVTFNIMLNKHCEGVNINFASKFSTVCNLSNRQAVNDWLQLSSSNY